MVESAQDCDASAALVCTGQGTHAQRVIELFDRLNGRWVADPDSLGVNAKRWKDMVLNYRLEQGDSGAARGLVYRNGRLDSVYRGGFQETRNGCFVECPKCRTRNFRGAALYRELDKAAKLGVLSLDVSYV